MPRPLRSRRSLDRKRRLDRSRYRRETASTAPGKTMVGRRGLEPLTPCASSRRDVFADVRPNAFNAHEQAFSFTARHQSARRFTGVADLVADLSHDSTGQIARPEDPCLHPITTLGRPPTRLRRRWPGRPYPIERIGSWPLIRHDYLSDCLRSAALLVGNEEAHRLLLG
jgi:hypothetical protein